MPTGHRRAIDNAHQATTRRQIRIIAYIDTSSDARERTKTRNFSQIGMITDKDIPFYARECGKVRH